MHIYIILYALGPLLAVWYVWWIYKIFKNRSELRKEQELRQQAHENGLKKINTWCDWIEKSRTDEELKEVGGCPYELRHWKVARLDAACKRYAEALVRLSSRSKATGLLKATEIGDLIPKMFAWCELLHLDDEDVLKYIPMDTLEIIFHFRLSFLKVVKKANTGDREAFLSLRKILVEEAQYERDVNRKKVVYRSPVFYPNNWNDLVTKYIENPALGEFAGISNDPEPGEIRLLAVEALRTRSLKDAKIVLAFCSISKGIYGTSGVHDYGGKSKQVIWPYRGEIGDVLLAELAKMVDQLHQERVLLAELEDAM